MLLGVVRGCGRAVMVARKHSGYTDPSGSLMRVPAPAFGCMGLHCLFDFVRTFVNRVLQ